jgi:hypothetical protein
MAILEGASHLRADDHQTFADETSVADLIFTHKSVRRGL